MASHSEQFYSADEDDAAGASGSAELPRAVDVDSSSDFSRSLATSSDADLSSSVANSASADMSRAEISSSLHQTASQSMSLPGSSTGSFPAPAPALSSGDAGLVSASAFPDVPPMVSSGPLGSLDNPSVSGSAPLPAANSFIDADTSGETATMSTASSSAANIMTSSDTFGHSPNATMTMGSLDQRQQSSGFLQPDTSGDTAVHSFASSSDANLMASSAAMSTGSIPRQATPLSERAAAANASGHTAVSSLATHSAATSADMSGVQSAPLSTASVARAPVSASSGVIAADVSRDAGAMSSSIDMWEQQATHGLENEEKKLAEIAKQMRTTVDEDEINPEFGSIKNEWGELATSAPLPVPADDTLVALPQALGRQTDGHGETAIESQALPDQGPPTGSAPLTANSRASSQPAQEDTRAVLSNQSQQVLVAAEDADAELADAEAESDQALDDEYTDDPDTAQVAPSVTAPSSEPFASGSMADVSAVTGEHSELVASDVTEDESGPDEDRSGHEVDNAKSHSDRGLPDQAEVDAGDSETTQDPDETKEASLQEDIFDEPLKVLASADLIDPEPSATLVDESMARRVTGKTETANIRVPNKTRNRKRSALGPHGVNAFALGTNIKVTKKSTSGKYSGLLIRQTEGKIVDLVWSSFSSNDDRLYALAVATDAGKTFLYFIWVTETSLKVLRECSFSAQEGTFHSKVNFAGTPLAGSLALVSENNSGLRVVSFKSASILPDLESGHLDENAQGTANDPARVAEEDEKVSTAIPDVKNAEESTHGSAVPVEDTVTSSRPVEPKEATLVSSSKAPFGSDGKLTVESPTAVNEPSTEMSHASTRGVVQQTSAPLSEAHSAEPSSVAKSGELVVGSSLGALPSPAPVAEEQVVPESTTGETVAEEAGAHVADKAGPADLSKTTDTDYAERTLEVAGGSDKYLEGPAELSGELQTTAIDAKTSDGDLGSITEELTRAANSDEVESNGVVSKQSIASLVESSGLVGEDRFADPALNIESVDTTGQLDGLLDSGDVPVTADFSSFPAPPVLEQMVTSGSLTTSGILPESNPLESSGGGVAVDAALEPEVPSATSSAALSLSAPPPPPALPPTDSGSLSRLSTADSTVMEAPPPPSLPSFRY